MATGYHDVVEGLFYQEQGDLCSFDFDTSWVSTPQLL